MEGLYQELRKTKTREEVRSCFFKAENISPTSRDYDATQQVLYLFGRERRFRQPNGFVGVLARAAYLLKEIKYSDATIPLPPELCVVIKEEAFIVETASLIKFSSKEKQDKYDWDRSPLSPCPKLCEDISKASFIKKIRIYDLTLPRDEAGFIATLTAARAVQESVFSHEKKVIDENNFLSVYEYWVSLFKDSLGKTERKYSEYFLFDIEKGTIKKGGKIEFDFSGIKEIKKFPEYEYNYFWSVYGRVKDEEELFSIRRKIDRLNEDYARRFEGEFYTPVPFASKAYEYLLKTVGKKKLLNGEYRVWDMAAGSGNLEFTLPSYVLPYTYISTLGEDDANYCKRIFYGATVFQYDYLNDDVEKLFSDTKREKWDEKQQLKMPQNLIEDLKNPKIKWIIFINPPFATSNESGLSAGKTSKTGVSDTEMRKVMLKNGYGETGRELFSQFLYRISREFSGKKGYLGLFSTLKYLNAPNDKKLRDGFFRYSPKRGFIFSSENFEGSKGFFPVAFAVWDMSKNIPISGDIDFDVYNNSAEKVGVKKVFVGDQKAPLSEWTPRPRTSKIFPPFTSATGIAVKNTDVRDRIAEGFLCSLMCCGNDVQHRNLTALFSGPQASAGSFSVTKDNFSHAIATHAVRRLIEPTWSNNRDQFYKPKEEPSEEFFIDCAVWSVFSDSDNATSLKDVEYKGNKYRIKNQLFPFLKEEVEQWGYEFTQEEKEEEESFFALWLKEKVLSPLSMNILIQARELYSYIYRSKKVNIFDVGYPQIKALAKENEEGMALLNALKTAQKELGKVLVKSVYQYGFIAQDVEYFKEEL